MNANISLYVPFTRELRKRQKFDATNRSHSNKLSQRLTVTFAKVMCDNDAATEWVPYPFIAIVPMTKKISLTKFSCERPFSCTAHTLPLFDGLQLNYAMTEEVPFLIHRPLVHRPYLSDVSKIETLLF